MRAIVDTHAHLCDPVFDDDLLQVLQRAESAGVRAFIAVGENMDDAVKNLALAARYPTICAAAGLYPTVLDLNLAAQMRDFIRVHKDQVVAIGEVGLDYWVVKNESDQEIQREILRGFVELSKELGLPLNVHSRSAGRYAVDLLLKEGASKVQLHAFDGKFGAAMPALEAGYFFSVPLRLFDLSRSRNLCETCPCAAS